jgi:hypothetical protein
MQLGILSGGFPIKIRCSTPIALPNLLRLHDFQVRDVFLTFDVSSTSNFQGFLVFNGWILSQEMQPMNNKVRRQTWIHKVHILASPVDLSGQ